LREQTVLMRAGHHSDLLELELTRRKVPFVKYGGIRYLDAADVKDLVCLLWIADNPGDQLAWFRLLQLLDGVGPATARRVLDGLEFAQPRHDRVAGRAVDERGAAAEAAGPAGRRGAD